MIVTSVCDKKFSSQNNVAKLKRSQHRVNSIILAGYLYTTLNNISCQHWHIQYGFDIFIIKVH